MDILKAFYFDKIDASEHKLWKPYEWMLHFPLEAVNHNSPFPWQAGDATLLQSCTTSDCKRVRCYKNTPREWLRNKRNESWTTTKIFLSFKIHLPNAGNKNLRGGKKPLS